MTKETYNTINNILQQPQSEANAKALVKLHADAGNVEMRTGCWCKQSSIATVYYTIIGWFNTIDPKTLTNE